MDQNPQNPQPLPARLLLEIEDGARALGISPRYLTKRLGQGGIFYDRLRAGKRIWPETYVDVKLRLEALLAEREAVATAAEDPRALLPEERAAG